MKFRKINDNTINCIITQDDLKKHGIDLDDLFDRKKNAVEFIKAIIVKAARTVNFNMKNEYTTMRLSILPDHSLSLTISQDPAETEKVYREKGLVFDDEDTGAAKKERKQRTVPAIEMSDEALAGSYLYAFSSLAEMAHSSHILASRKGIRSAVYFDKNTSIYYLILDKGPDADDSYESAVLSVYEFGQMVTCSEKTLAYLKEHSDCIIKSEAVQKIAELYS